VQNDVTIRLNRSLERKYKQANNERTVVNEQNPPLVPHDNISNALIWPLHAPICNFSAIRITKIWMQQQFQVLQNTRVW